MEEDELINAGSGGGGGGTSPPNMYVDDSQNVVNDAFSSQDFRRHAVEGSYGAGKDTSFRSFDEEAYNSAEDPINDREVDSLGVGAISKSDQHGNGTEEESVNRVRDSDKAMAKKKRHCRESN
eukprot:scaffold9673_cov108-Cylindrotheca_fusiformis.AAC.1